jgi:proteasome lid subunit RPN8/RPN11
MSHIIVSNYSMTSKDGAVEASFSTSWDSTVVVKCTKAIARFDSQCSTDVKYWSMVLDLVSSILNSGQPSDMAANPAGTELEDTLGNAANQSSATDSKKKKAKDIEKPDSTTYDMVTERDLDKSKQTAYSITNEVYQQIHDKIGKHLPELGGMLGGSRNDRKVTHFHFDAGADATAATYSPDTDTLNKVLTSWNDQGIDLVGMIHSHPKNFTRPSYGDEEYAKAFLAACKNMSDFFMPIVQSERHGRFDIKGYVVSRHPSGHHRLAPVDYRLI